jgi:hypothetical protein
MEWFYGPKGLKFSEIGCRPPGVRAWDLYAAATRSTSTASGPWPWCTAALAAPLAPLRRGHHRAPPRPRRPHLPLRRRRRAPPALRPVAPRLAPAPPPGTPTQPVEAGYMANAWMRMKHPDYDELRGMLDFVGQTVKVRVVLLGAQRFDPTLGEAMAAHAIDGPVATITAGWQEREDDDEELHEHLGGRTVNLQLTPAARTLFRKTRSSRRPPRAPGRAAPPQDFYRIRLEHALEAERVSAPRSPARASSRGARRLDRRHSRPRRLAPRASARASGPSSTRSGSRCERPPSRATARDRAGARRLRGRRHRRRPRGGAGEPPVLFGVGDAARRAVVFAWSAGRDGRQPARGALPRLAARRARRERGARRNGLGLVPRRGRFPSPSGASPRRRGRVAHWPAASRPPPAVALPARSRSPGRRRLELGGT